MSDELIERVARALAEDAEWRPWSNLRQCEKKLFRSRAQAALAAIPDNCVIREGQAYDFTCWAMGEARLTAEEMRERCAALIEDERFWEQIPGQAWSGAIREAANHIRALSVEPGE